MRRLTRILKFAVIAVGFLALFSFIVMRLWNWLTPALFGWHAITYWQALGILILSKILFSGFRGGPGRHSYWRHRMIERWARMTPEERERFRQSMRSRCGGFAEPTPASKD